MIRAETLAAASAENRAIANEHDDGDAVLAASPIDAAALQALGKERGNVFLHVLTMKSLNARLSADEHVELLHMALSAAWVDGAIVGARASQIGAADG